MYNNIGKKIKGLAVAELIIGIIISFIAGIVFKEGEGYTYNILKFVIGVGISFVGTWVLYGLGEIVEKTCEMKTNSDILVKSLCKNDEELIRLELLYEEGKIEETEYEEKRKDIINKQ